MKEAQVMAEAIRFWMKKRSVTQAELAEKSGLAQNYISQIHTGKRSGSLDAIQNIATALDVSLPEFFACRDESLPEIVFVDKVKARPRAGNGGLETDSECEEKYSFHSSFIARKHGTPEDMKVFEVAGDSMAPTLNDRDLILVNLKEKHIRSGYVYLIRIGDELMVKRLENRPGGTLLIRSDNPAYDDIPVNLGEAEGDIAIHGRMVWSCREY